MTGGINKLVTSGMLVCPSCKGTLRMSSALSCETCHVEYPLLDEIPIILEKPQEHIGRWNVQFRNYVTRQQNTVQHEQGIIGSPAFFPPQKERLKHVVEARIANWKTITDLLAPLRELGPGDPPRNAVAGVFPDFASLFYLFRDWGWDTDEPDLMCDKIREILPDDLSIGSLLVLGAGGCRESFILHEHYNCPLTVSADINPFNLLSAARIISGNELNLYQVLANNVRNARDNVSYWKMSAPRKPKDEFLYTVADATRLPFAGNSFHVVVTPFLIDAVDDDFRALARKINHVIQPGGYWANYGAMSFTSDYTYTGEELLAIVEDSGFRIMSHGYVTKPHVAPRESCLHHVYDCLYFSARKEPF